MIVKIIDTKDQTYYWQTDRVRHWTDTISVPYDGTMYILDDATPLPGNEGEPVRGNYIYMELEGGNTHSVFTNCSTYLMNDNGKTIEVLR